ESAQERRGQFFQRLCSLYRTAKSLELPETSASCRSMILERFPMLLSTQQYIRLGIIQDAAQTLEQVVGVKEGFAFLLDEYDHVPTLARRLRYDAWQACH